MNTTSSKSAPRSSQLSPLDATERARLAELEPIIERGLTGFVEVGTALLEISDRRLYREKNSTFAEYVADKWKMTARRAYQLCEAAEIVKALPENVNNCSQSLITNEGQARELAKVEPDRRVEVLKAAASTGKLTAKSIKDTASQTAFPFKCDECEETCEDETEAQPLYQCADCGGRFTPENSADGCGHRCPSCNKFGSKPIFYSVCWFLTNFPHGCDLKLNLVVSTRAFFFLDSAG
jgi:DNA-directed RNA polymerase subunit RPC12/RpoP